MSDSGKPSVSCVRKARDARRKRLEIQRMVNNFEAEISSPFVSDVDCCGMKRRMSFKEMPLDEALNAAGEDSKIDKGGGNLASELSLSASSSQSSEGGSSPVGTLVADDEMNVEKKSNILSCLPHGWISIIGRRRLMEDAVSVEPGIVAGEFAFFAVYDGHGGSRVANACRDRLHQLLAKEIEGGKITDKVTADGGVINWEKVMMASFANMDEEVSGGAGGSEFEIQNGTSVSVRTIGSTAVVVMVGKKEVVVANCGDSRAVMCRGGTAVPLSHDHKPDRPDERDRVEAAGGRVINWNGCRVLGVLATSRSIGDHYLKPYVISEPEVTVCERTKSDDFLIIATDGLWDVVSNEVACEVVRKCLHGQLRRRFSKGRYPPAEAAAMLAELAMAKGSKDNISVIVVQLKKTSCSNVDHL